MLFSVWLVGIQITTASLSFFCQNWLEDILDVHIAFYNFKFNLSIYKLYTNKDNFFDSQYTETLVNLKMIYPDNLH